MQDNLFLLPYNRQPDVLPGHNLRAPLTRLVGRHEEEVAICTLLRQPETRLLTLTGTGGVGKTRLAVHVAFNLLDDFVDGVYFISLASISDPNLVLSTIAHTLDLWDAGDGSLLTYLQNFLKEKHLLLVLDNFEQVIPAALSCLELLQACPQLKLLVTSRARLHVSGEQEFLVSPLSLPDVNTLPQYEALTEYAALELFVQRARAVKPGFQLTTENMRTVAAICTRLDGLPLAIELAAARIKLLSPQALLGRLSHRLQVLTDGVRDAPERQQTLRKTIAWSYDLLTTDEQHLFRSMCIFVGGCTLEAAEAVTPMIRDTEGDVLDNIASLLDKSLLQQREQFDGQPRLVLLETVREYGLECLIANGEMERVQQAHTDYYLAFVEEVETRLGGSAQEMELERLELEHDNIRAALQWSLEEGKATRNMDRALRFGGALRRFWTMHGYYDEGLNFLEQALSEPLESSLGRQGSQVRARAMSAAANLALDKGYIERGEVLAQESCVLYRAIGEARGVAFALHQLERVARTRGNHSKARVFIEESLALWREIGDQERIAWSLFRLARQDSELGSYSSARNLFEESLTLFEQMSNNEGVAWGLFRLAEMLFISQTASGEVSESRVMNPATTGSKGAGEVSALLEKSLLLMKKLGDQDGIGNCLSLAARVSLAHDNVAAARSLIERSLPLLTQSGHRESLAQSLRFLAEIAAREQIYTLARDMFEESLACAKELGIQGLIASSLEGLACVVLAEGSTDRTGNARWTTRLLSVAQALREAIGVPLPPVERSRYERAVAEARQQLGDAVFASVWAEGRVMTPEEAIAVQGDSTPVEHTLHMLNTLNPLNLSHTPNTSQPVVNEHSKQHTDTVSKLGLTRREIEVLRLLAQGLSDAQIAEKLVVSPRTINWHLTSIYSKLGVSSRSGATRYAVEHQLI